MMLAQRAPRASFTLLFCLLLLGCQKSRLATAVRANDFSAAKGLLERGANPDALTKAKWPVLVEAAYADNTEMVHQLLLHGANVNASNPNGFTALMESSRKGNLAAVKELLERKASTSSIDSEGGWNPLILAAEAGHEDIVSLLLAAGADPNSTDKRGGAALMSAARGGHLQVVRQLVAAHANVNYRAPNELAASAASEAIAADSNGAAVLQVLLDAGANVETQSWRGETLLVEASRLDNRDAALLLLYKGADPNMVGGYYRKSPLLWAASHNDTELIKALLKSHAFVEATVDGKTLCAACEAIDQNAPEALHLLLGAGADPNFADPEDHETLLMRAVRIGHVQSVQTLLHAGANTSAKNSDGKTAADLAHDGENTEIEAALTAR